MIKVNICNYEAKFGLDGILTKHALEMEKHLKPLCEVSVTSEPDLTADVIHHINYLAYHEPTGKIDTTMVTHVTGDDYQSTETKLNTLKRQLETSTGICFSPRMVEYLTQRGLDKSKLEFVLPAHDSLPRRPIVIALLSDKKEDGRKNEWLLERLAKNIDTKKFGFRIMGKGWETFLEPLVEKYGLQVEYFNEFKAEYYKAILDSSDYLFYPGGEDCLAQSIIDATQNGLKVISNPQYDIDVDLPFKNEKELIEIFKNMEVNPVSEWTWDNYSLKHYNIWKKLYENKSR